MEAEPADAPARVPSTTAAVDVGILGEGGVKRRVEDGDGGHVGQQLALGANDVEGDAVVERRELGQRVELP